MEQWTSIVNNLKMCQTETESFITKDGNFKCRFSTCDKAFKFDGVSRIKHELSHNGFVYKKPPSCSTVTFGAPNEKDDCLNYQICLLEYGMMLKNFHDAISEADGERILRQWKYMLMYFRADGQSSAKYALESLYILLQYYALLFPFFLFFDLEPFRQV